MANVGKIEIKYSLQDFDIQKFKDLYYDNIDTTTWYNPEFLNELKELLEMKIERVNEEKRYGKIIRMGSVLLDEEYNGAKTWNIENIKGVNSYSLRQDTSVVVIFSGKKIVKVEDALGYISKLIAQTNVDLKQVQQKERKRQLPEDGFYITEFQRLVLEAIPKKLSEIKDNVIVALKGAAGYGKTSFAQYYARKNQKPILIIDCSTIADNEAWFVNPQFKGGETSYQLTKLSEFLMQGDCVILFDEINRMPTWVSNALLPILDHRKYTHVRGQDIQVSNNIVFFMTANEGMAYAGTSAIDQAIKRRIFGTIVVEALPQEIECEVLESRYGLDYEVSKNIVKIMSRLREDKTMKEYPVNVSTGTSLNVAFWVSSGLSLRQAFELAIQNDAPVETHKIIADSLGLTGN